MRPSNFEKKTNDKEGKSCRLLKSNYYDAAMKTQNSANRRRKYEND
jgi:hypothetical protein